MEFFGPTGAAFGLLLTGDAELWRIIFTSLSCSLIALLLISPPAIALGFLIAKVAFPGRRALVVLVQALLSFPTVVVGLVIYMLLSRQGPLGFLKLLFTPEAIIIGYMVIAFPVLVVFTLSAVQGADPRVYETARSLGAGRWRAALTTLFECASALWRRYSTASGVWCPKSAARSWSAATSRASRATFRPQLRSRRAKASSRKASRSVSC